MLKIKGETSNRMGLNTQMGLLCMALTLPLIIAGCAHKQPDGDIEVHFNMIINDSHGDRMYNSDCPNGCWWNSMDNDYQPNI